MNVLDGMARAEALTCIVPIEGSAFIDAILVVNGRAYAYTQDIGLGYCSHPTVERWQAAINAHYDELEKPKWVDGRGLVGCSVDFHGGSEQLLIPGLNHNEDTDRMLKLINARTKIEGFVAANGGGGGYMLHCYPQGLCVTGYPPTILRGIGVITCATRELAEECIRRFPAELRLLAGLEGAK